MDKDNSIKDDNILLLNCVAEVVSAYVSNHNVPLNELPDVMSEVHKNFVNLSKQNIGQSGYGVKPAVSVDDSITNDYLICLEDGKRLKMLKRYLRTKFGLTPDEYRSKWGLPANYPMVAPGYAARRSQFAKDIGLGTNRKK